MTVNVGRTLSWSAAQIAQTHALTAQRPRQKMLLLYVIKRHESRCIFSPRHLFPPVKHRNGYDIMTLVELMPDVFRQGGRPEIALIDVTNLFDFI